MNGVAECQTVAGRTSSGKPSSMRPISKRREDVASLQSGYGPRVQLSVFECEVRSTDELRSLRATLRERIDPLEDQVRRYPTTAQTFAGRSIIGARTVEERSDY